MNAFVIGSPSTNKHKVYCYDERCGGKGVNELCSMRWVHYHRMYSQFIKNELVDKFPHTLILVFDNCVGQN